jgi:predicted Zn-dependent protease
MSTSLSDSTTAVYMLAYQYLCQGNYAKAEVLLKVLVLIAPDHPELRLALAYALIGLNRAEDAIDALAEIDSAGVAVVHFLRGKALVMAGRDSEAQDAFSRYRDARMKNTNDLGRSGFSTGLPTHG